MQSGFTSSCDIIKNIAPLLPQARHGGQQPLSKVTPGATLGPKAALAPEYDGTQGLLSRVIGKLHSFMVDKSPQRRLVLEQGATQRRTLGVLTECPFPQQGTHLQPELPHIDAE